MSPIKVHADGRSGARRTYLPEAKAARLAFVRYWKTGRSMETREDLVACAKAMKMAGLYSVTTYDGDIATSIRKMMKQIDGGGK